MPGTGNAPPYGDGDGDPEPLGEAVGDALGLGDGDAVAAGATCHVGLMFELPPLVSRV